jgi:Endonuclease/Exonuclease/phosphatase family
MRLLAWNLNHRAARRRIPSWIATAINQDGPDILVLTEYVEGQDHASFVADLKATGLSDFSCTIQPGGENQLLIATRVAHQTCDLIVPKIHSSVPSNVLKIALEGGLTIIGVRIPAFVGKDCRSLKRATWTWLLGEADRLRDCPAIIVGDFNTAPGDPRDDCGDCLEELVHGGWQHSRPMSGCSWRSRTGTERQIDHIFLSKCLRSTRVEYQWSYQEMTRPLGASVKPGIPDHAMLLCDFDGLIEKHAVAEA